MVKNYDKALQEIVATHRNQASYRRDPSMLVKQQISKLSGQIRRSSKRQKS